MSKEYDALLEWAENSQDFMQEYGKVTKVTVDGTVVKFYEGSEEVKSVDLKEYGVKKITDKAQDIVMEKGIDTTFGTGTYAEVSDKIDKLSDIVDAAKAMDKIKNYDCIDDIDLNDMGDIITPLTGLAGELGGPLGLYIGQELYIGNECLQKGKAIAMKHNRDLLSVMMLEGGYEEELKRQADICGVTPEEYLKFMYKNGDIDESQLKEALADLGGKATKARKVDPVVLDLNGNKEITKNLESGAHFDLNNDGFAEKTEWIENKDGFLVRDLNENGIIDSGKELIGDGLELSDGKVSANGLEVLLDMDKNNDRIINSLDEGFDKFKIWIDANGDGITDDGELKTLKELDIEGFKINESMSDDIKIGKVIKGDGTELILGDLFFNVDNIDTKEVDKLNIKDGETTDDESITDEIKRLPQIKATGTVENLRDAMKNDDELKELVKNYCSSVKIANLDNINNLLYRWCKVQDLEVNSRGSNIDARVLGVIEKFTGNNFEGVDGKNPNAQAAVLLKEMYSKIKKYVSKELERQSYLAKYMCAIEGKYNIEKEEIYFDLSKLKNDIKSIKNPVEEALILRGLVNVYESEGLVVNKLNVLADEFSEESQEFSNVYNIEKYISSSNVQGNEYGTNSSDYIISDKNSKNIYAGSGNDVIESKEGNNILYGAAGNDVYIYGKGYGNDVIDNSTSSSQDVDVLVMKDINYDDVYIQVSGKNLILKIKEINEEITIRNYFSGGSYALDEIVFADGKKVNYVEMVDFINKNGMTLEGTKDDDILNYKSESIKLTVKGKDGDDTITGSSNDDVLYGEDGNDTLKGGYGNDTLDGGLRNDSLYGEAGDDVLDGAVGNDYLDGGTGSDTYIFAKGYGKDIINNYTSGTNDVDTLKFKDINYDEIDILVNGNDLILKVKDSNDKVTIQNYFTGDLYSLEKIEFADGKTITFSEMVRYIQSKGIEVLGTEGDDTIDYTKQWINLNAYGKSGDDTITGGSGSDNIYGEGGNDTLHGGLGNDYLYGGERNDTLNGGSGNDVLDGGIGNDTLYGEVGNDTYVFKKGYGKDIIDNVDSDNKDLDVLVMKDINYDEIEMVVSGKDLVLNLKDSDDSVRILNYFNGGEYSLENIKFADGKNISYSALVKDIKKNGMKVEGTDMDDNISKKGQWIGFNIDGGKGNDIIEGGSGNDTLYGGSDNDKLYGDVGDDILDGGIGDDYLYGGIGDDTYIFGKGYGKDTIENSPSTSDSNYIDTLKMKDINYDEVDFVVSGDNLIIKVKDTEDSLTISNYFKGGVYSVRSEIEFADGVILYYNDVMEYVYEKGNLIHGSNKSETLSYDKEWVKMIIQGEDGDDIITGGTGNDVIYGGNNNDTLNGGDGSDVLYGDKDNDILSSGRGNDILDGGIGNDTLDGGTGNDVYIFKKGYGKDIIDNYSSETSDIDVLQLEGLNYENIEIAVDKSDLIIKVKDSDDQITIKNYLLGGKYCLEEIQFDDGEVLGYSDIIAFIDNGGIIISGTDEDDVLTYGNDIVRLNIKGGEGNDTITTGSGNDVIYGQNGNDILSGGSGNDSINGGEGNDTIIGGIGNDILTGESGNDTLDGGTGDDVYIFAKGYGSDIIDNYSSGTTDVDILKFKDIKYEEINIEVRGNDLILRVLGSEDNVKIKNYFSGGSYIVEKIEFNDDKTLTYNDVLAYVNANGIKIIGEKNDDVLNYSGEWVNIDMKGNEGNDELTTGTGSDILDGGIGNDSMTGGSGNDTYVFAKGYGKDTIVNYGSGANDIDVLKFKDIKYEDTSIMIKGNNLTFNVKGTNDSITIQDYFAGESYSIEKIIFSDETTFSYGDITKFANKTGVELNGTTDDDVIEYSKEWAKFNVNGHEGDDTITTGSGNDVIYGEKGNDTLTAGSGDDIIYGGEDNDKIYGGAGNDILDGGLGNDYFGGDAGNDMYIFKKGYGKDVINNYYSAGSDMDSLKLVNINYDDVNIIVSDRDLILKLKDSDDQVTVKNYFSGGSYSLEKIYFADDITITYEEMVDYVNNTGVTVDGTNDDDILNYNRHWVRLNINGNEGDDTITGGDVNDELHGNKGNDTMYGGYGADIIHGDENNDILYGGYGADKLYGDANNDHLYGENDDDYLDGGSGNDYIAAGYGNDNLIGGDGDDNLYGEYGDDILDGGLGNDYLSGGYNNDTYIFGRGYGEDKINNYTGYNTYTDKLILKDLTFDETELMVEGNNLIIKIKGSDDKVVVENYLYSDYYTVSSIEFVDKVMKPEDVSKYIKEVGMDVIGTSEDDEINKSKSTNVRFRIYGGLGNDKIYGGNVNDDLDGGEGDDYLDGGSGNDTYAFGKGYGKDTINNYSSATEDLDSLKLKELNITDVDIVKDGDNLVIKVKDSSDLVTIEKYFAGGNYSVESIEFADGTVKDPTEIQSYIDAQSAQKIIETEVDTKTISEEYTLMNQVYCQTSSEMPISETSYNNNVYENNDVNLFKSDMTKN